jgi:hypothetical protein
MKVWARINHIGWVHLWTNRESYEAGEASKHFFNGKAEPRWQEAIFSDETLRIMRLGELVQIQDPGYFSDEDIDDIKDISSENDSSF